jgi:hypothetical protein
MAEYVWQHDLKGESDRLRLMSDLLDPSSEFHLLRRPISKQCQPAATAESGSTLCSACART